MILIYIMLVVIVIIGSWFIFRIKKNSNADKDHKQFSVLKNKEVPTASAENEKVVGKNDSGIEVLDLNDVSKNSINEKADTLDLDDLFKTISLTKAEEEKDFDFTLQRSEKK